MHRFTCDEKKSCENMKKSRNIMEVIVGLDMDTNMVNIKSVSV